MKKIQSTFFLLLAFSLNICAAVVIDTSTAVYDFNSLATGNLNGQNGWITTKYSTTADFQVSSGGGYDLTNALTFSISGPSVGVDASRSFASLFSNTAFSSTASKYIISFDVSRSYWGFQFIIGADINNDGKITNGDAAEKALSFSTSSQGGEKLTLPNGTIYSYPTALTSAWTTVEITLSNFNSTSSGNISVRSKVLGTATWNTIATNLALGIDTNASDKKNPGLWKMIFAHCEGATGKLDNISITRIGPQILTSISKIKAEYNFRVYPNPAGNFMILESKGSRTDVCFTLRELTGREVKKIQLENPTEVISISELANGIYFYTLSTPSGKVMDAGKIIINRHDF